MDKFFSLLKASLSEGMSLFRIRTKDKTSGRGAILFIVVAIIFYIFVYANSLFDMLEKSGEAAYLLALFVVATFALTLFEGIYKSSSLIFNCKDNDLLLSLPIRRAEIVAVRIIKFYLFELAYNSLFLVPAILTYIIRADVSLSFYFVSATMIFLTPIIPIMLSCILGAVVSVISGRLKRKNLIQIILSAILLAGVLGFAVVSTNILNAGSEGDVAAAGVAMLTKAGETASDLYYPAKLYMKLSREFKVLDFGAFIIINILIGMVTIFILSKLYSKINVNSYSTRQVKKKQKAEFNFKQNTPRKAIIKKELNRFFNSPVFVVNAGFGLIIFPIGVGAICWKSNVFVDYLLKNMPFLESIDMKELLAMMIFGLMIFCVIMTFITQVSISLEGKAINFLKTLPVRASEIVKAKILAALIIILPLILVGDSIAAVWFKFGLVEISLILAASFIIPAAMQTMEIMIDLKHPTLDAENDTEIVKQSRSSMIATFVALAFAMLTLSLMVGLTLAKMSIATTMFIVIVFYLFILAVAWLRLEKRAGELFEGITA